jgi:hypothetical protein
LLNWPKKLRFGICGLHPEVNEGTGERCISGGFEDDGHHVQIGGHGLSDHGDASGELDTIDYEFAAEIDAFGGNQSGEAIAAGHVDLLTRL